MTTTDRTFRAHWQPVFGLVLCALGIGGYWLLAGRVPVHAASEQERDATAAPIASELRAPASTSDVGKAGAADSRLVRGHGYVVDMTFEEQNAFKGTTAALRGVVKEVLPPRYVKTGKLEYVYTPLVLEVSKVYRGRIAAKQVTIRAFGGTAGGITYEADFAPSDEIRGVGVELIVLGADPLVVPGDEPMEAMTPNGVHVIRDGNVVDVTHADYPGLKPERVLPLDAAEAALAR